MADDEKPEQHGSGAEANEQGCPVKMDGGRRCGRPIYNAPAGVDEKPVCLMHSRDPNKSDQQFQKESERVLKDAKDGIADFTHFVFPSANYSGRTFEARCIFIYATFTQRANFRVAKFTQAADFSHATFTQGANFTRAMFTQRADFIYATFTQGADFSFAKFTQPGDFRWATFEEGAEFRKTVFRDDDTREPGPVFSLTRFEKPEAVVFYDTYLGQALFHNCDV